MSTLTEKTRRAIRSKIPLRLKNKTTVAAIDCGKENIKLAVLELRDRSPVLVQLLETAAFEDEILNRINNDCRVRSCNIQGYEVKTIAEHYPRMPSKDLDTVIERTVSRQFGEDATYACRISEFQDKRVEALIIATPQRNLSKTFTRLKQMGVNVDRVYPTSLALAQCLHAAKPQVSDSTVAVVDIGAIWSHLVILDRGKLALSRSIKVGVDDFVAAIRELCEHSEDYARRMLTERGIDISALPQVTPERAYSEAIRDTTEWLTKEVLRSLAFGSKRLSLPLPKTLYLTGAGSTIPGITTAIQTLTEIRTQTLDPLECVSTDQNLEPPPAPARFSIAIGLALLTATEAKPFFSPGNISQRKGRRSMVPAYLSLIGLATTLIAGSVAFNSTCNRYETAISAQRSSVEAIREKLVATGADNGIVTDTRRHLAFALIEKPIPRWKDILKEFSAMIPANVLIDELSFTQGEEDWQIADWRFVVRGTITDPQGGYLLSQMKENLENSDVFTDIVVSPLGSTDLELAGKRIQGAIAFEIEGRLE